MAAPVNYPYVESFDRTVPSFALFFAKEYAIGFVLGAILAIIVIGFPGGITGSVELLAARLRRSKAKTPVASGKTVMP